MPALQMSKSISSSMPGAYSLPFDFSIEQCTLIASFQTTRHRYFAAPFERSSATHSLLGNVIVQGDSIGIRMSVEDGSMEWYVDNSRYNGMSTVWHRPMRKEDGVEFAEVAVPVVDARTESTSITYDGLLLFCTDCSFQQETALPFGIAP